MQLENSNIKNAILKGGLGLGFLLVFIVSWIFDLSSSVFIGFLALVMAVLFMNGLAQIDIIVDKNNPRWWKNNIILRTLHHIHGEGELAGIWVGVILFAYLYFHGESSAVHLPLAAALGLSGIMAAANIATKRIIPIMNLLERFVGVWGAVWIGSMLSTLTGAASSVFVSRYLLDRVEAKDKDEVALRLSAGIGLGNGILPFVAPPVLIVWASLQERLGWGLLDLFLMVGLIGIIYSGYITHHIKDLVKDIEVRPKASFFSIELGVLVLIVLGNIIAYTSPWMMIFNALVSLAGAYLGEDNNSKWQPIILGGLLMALEIIGHTAEPFVYLVITSALPQSMPILALGVILFLMSAWTSHVADNALASRIFIGTLFGMGYVGAQMDFLVASVLIGALFGGFLLIPANIPNFPIARIFGIESGAWFKAGLKIYWTTVIPLAWIVGLYFLV
ncbi:MAG: hypothetical protein PHE73_07240 [Sulfurovaceae bacterium]|nr:hypothetical protein [Sulfurovaceae bacterium]